MITSFDPDGYTVLGLAYLLPILYGAVVYGFTWLIGQGGFTTEAAAEVASEHV